MQIIKGNQSGRIRVFASLLGTHKLNISGHVYKLADPNLDIRILREKTERSGAALIFCFACIFALIFLVGPLAFLALPLLFVTGKRTIATLELILPNRDRYIAVADRKELQILARYITRP